MKDNLVAFFEDNFVNLNDAKVSIMCHAFMYGTAIFEGIRGYYNSSHDTVYLFRLNEHIQRLLENIKILRLEIKYTQNDIYQLIVDLVNKNNPKEDIYIRPSVYNSAKKIGPGLGTINPSDLSIFMIPFGDYFNANSGLKVQVSSWRRVEDNAIPARGKIVGAYANTALAKGDAQASGFDDCIVLTESGHVSEGSAMNIFLVKHGKLITSSITDNILEGITRDTVIKLAKSELNIETMDRTIDRSELYLADEIFFCGTGAQITPVLNVDNRKIGNEQVGSITAKIQEQYLKTCRGELNKFKDWLTPVKSTSQVH